MKKINSLIAMLFSNLSNIPMPQSSILPSKRLIITLLRLLIWCFLLNICKAAFAFQNYDLTSTSLVAKKSGFSVKGATSSYLGYSVSTAGDINNDGYADIIIGAHNINTVYVIYGGPTSSFTDFNFNTDTLDYQTTGFWIKGEASGDGFGYAVATAGDIDNDGYDDIIIGAQMKDSSRGAVYVIYGGEKGDLPNRDLSSYTLLPASTGFVMYGETAGDTFGYAVNSAGDVNKDDYDDIIIGGFGKGGNKGVAYLVYGGPKGSFQGIDLSNDALDPLTTGFRILGAATNDQFGYSASTAGDFNKDGYADILIAGYRKYNFQGIAYVIYGGEKADLPNRDLSSYTLLPASTGFWIIGNLAGDYFGRIANYAGDVNKDGYADLIIGAYRKDTSKGIAYVIYGKPKTSTQHIDLSAGNLDPSSTGFSIKGSAANTGFGASASYAGDLNNDGYADIIIGGSSTLGTAFVIYGGASLQSIDLSLISLNPATQGFYVKRTDVQNYLGYSVRTAGDINGDGFDDIIIGAYGGAGQMGAAYVIHNGCLTDHCTTCVARVCTVCDAGYGLDTSSECPACPTNCALCTTSTVCDTCSNTYFLSQGGCVGTCPDTKYGLSGVCESCSTNCKKCTSSSACTECVSPSLLSNSACVATCPDGTFPSSGSCQACSSDCKTCTSATSCQTCNTGYFVDNAACSSCSTNCDQCTSSLVCTKCTSPYLLYQSQCTLTTCPAATFQSSNECKGCSSNCLSCSSASSCQTCAQKYVVENSACANCPTNCDSCSSSSTCDSCTTPYLLYQSQCTLTTCPAVTFKSGNECKDCSAHCSSCTSATSCQACSSGYFVENSACSPCSSNCDQCTSSSVCTQCTSPYLLYQSQCTSTVCPAATFKSGNECKDCSSHCSSCTSATSCQACSTGYFVDNSACSPCSSNCNQCTSSSVCTQCTSPYLLYQTQCVYTTCPSKTFKDNNECKDCPTGCSSCTSHTACQTCDQGFALSSSNSLCENCPTNCDQCSTPSTCDICSSPYLLYQTQCVYTTCPSKTFEDNNECKDCPTGCSSCISHTSCQACDQSYTLASNSLCENCPINCHQCSTSSTCAICTSPYLLYEFQCIYTTCPSATFQSNNECKDCPAHCLSCTSETSCQTCDQGYVLSVDSSCALPSNKATQQVVASSVTGIGSVLSVGSSAFPMNSLISKIVQNTRYIDLVVTEKLADAYKTWNTQLISWDFPDVLSKLDTFKPVPVLFSQYSIDSPFLVNFWSPAMTIGVGLAVFIGSLLLRIVLEKIKIRGWFYSLVNKLVMGSFNFTLAQAYGCLDDVLFYCVLDFKTNPFNTVFSWGSFFCTLAFLGIGAALIWLNIKIIRKYQSQKSDLGRFNEENEYWELFYSDFNDNDGWSQSFLAIQVVRSSLSSLIITTLDQTSLIQTTNLLIIDGAMITFLIAKKPLTSLRAKFAQYFYEIITLLVHLCVFILSLDNHNRGEAFSGFRSAVCTSIIYLNNAIVFGGCGFMLLEIYKTIKEVYNAWKLRRSEKKTVSPITLENSPETQNDITISQPVTEQSIAVRERSKWINMNERNRPSVGRILPVENNNNTNENSSSFSVRNFQPFQTFDSVIENSVLQENDTSNWVNQDQSQGSMMRYPRRRMIKGAKRTYRNPSNAGNSGNL